MRLDGRANDEMRPVEMIVGYQEYAEGSVLISVGKTRVLCAVTVEEGLPSWLSGQEYGWVTAEYTMLPRATRTRTPRDASARETEIQQFIGRALRASVDLTALSRRTITVDCDVIQADGGTRTAAITGGYVALALALEGMLRKKQACPQIWRPPIAAVSVGLVDGEMLLDLGHEEDIRAVVDSNVVLNAEGQLIEVHAPATNPFHHQQLDEMLDLAREGVRHLLDIETELLRRYGVSVAV